MSIISRRLWVLLLTAVLVGAHTVWAQPQQNLAGGGEPSVGADGAREGRDGAEDGD